LDYFQCQAQDWDYVRVSDVQSVGVNLWSQFGLAGQQERFAARPYFAANRP
jgi:hypothetical protein